MKVGRIDPKLTDLFNSFNLSSSSVQSSHQIAASIDSDNSNEIIKELPAVGPISYLKNLDILLAQVEYQGFEFLVERPDVSAISDAELLHRLPEPKEADQAIRRTSREMMRGDSSLFGDAEGKGITVAVMDTGIFASHSSLKGKVLDQISCVQGDKSSGDNHGHGTHVAGSIAGTEIGVACEAEILDLRVFGEQSGASTSSILMALDYCVSRNVNIVNMSLGSNYPSRVLDNAVDAVYQSGVLPIIAAGNSGPDRFTINSPSSAKLALSVAATDSAKNVAYFSSRGPCSWYPWQKPDCAGFGVDVYSASHKGGFTVMSGTSMATPGVSGVAACLLEHNNDNPGAFAFVDSMIRHGGESNNQSVEWVGSGFISLEGIEKYISGHGGLNSMSKKKKNQHVSKQFFTKSVLKCTACENVRILHQISHRSDDTMAFRMSCPKHRTLNEDGHLKLDEVILENWRHVKIPDNQIIRSLKKCGKCEKMGLIPIEANPIKVGKGHHEHTKLNVGCLYCGAKGERKIPKRLSEMWMN